MSGTDQQKPNSMLGTNSKTFKMTPLTCADICAIIKECGQNGVREFRIDSFHISYGPSPAQAIEPVVVAQAIQNIQNSQASEANERRVQETQEERLQNLLLDDPAEYERQLLREELVDEQRSEED